MCNRYAFIADAAMMNLLRQLGLASASPKTRYNIAPTNLVPAVRATAKGNRLEMMRWGLMPPWEAVGAKATGFTNARSETISEKPAFRAAFKSRRCLIPASGFYEWKHEGKIRQPFYIYRTDEKPMLFAGIHPVCPIRPVSHGLVPVLCAWSSGADPEFHRVEGGGNL